MQSVRGIELHPGALYGFEAFGRSPCSEKWSHGAREILRSPLDGWARAPSKHGWNNNSMQTPNDPNTRRAAEWRDYYGLEVYRRSGMCLSQSELRLKWFKLSVLTATLGRRLGELGLNAALK